MHLRHPVVSCWHFFSSILCVPHQQESWYFFSSSHKKRRVQIFFWFERWSFFSSSQKNGISHIKESWRKHGWIVSSRKWKVCLSWVKGIWVANKRYVSHEWMIFLAWRNGICLTNKWATHRTPANISSQAPKSPLSRVLPQSNYREEEREEEKEREETREEERDRERKREWQWERESICVKERTRERERKRARPRETAFSQSDMICRALFSNKRSCFEHNTPFLSVALPLSPVARSLPTYTPKHNQSTLLLSEYPLIVWESPKLQYPNFAQPQPTRKFTQCSSKLQYSNFAPDTTNSKDHAVLIRTFLGTHSQKSAHNFFHCMECIYSWLLRMCS